MSEARFRRLVDEYIDGGHTVDEAIAMAAHDAAHYEDPFDVMKRAALDSTSDTE